MLLTKLIGTFAALALLAPAAADARRHDDWHKDHDHDRKRDDGAAAGVALGIGLVAIAAAVAASNKRKAEERRDSYRYGYGGSYGSDSYAPASGVICYRGERRCYVRGQFSYEWTDSQFSYDPYRRGYRP